MVQEISPITDKQDSMKTSVPQRELSINQRGSLKNRRKKNLLAVHLIEDQYLEQSKNFNTQTSRKNTQQKIGCGTKQRVLGKKYKQLISRLKSLQYHQLSWICKLKLLRDSSCADMFFSTLFKPELYKRREPQQRKYLHMTSMQGRLQGHVPFD